MPNLTRRNLVAGLGAAVPLAAVPVMVAPVLARPEPDALGALIDATADADLLALGRRSDDAEDRLADAQAARKAARERFDAIAPELPAELLDTPGGVLWGGPERDVEERILNERHPREGRRQVVTAEQIRLQMEDYKPRSRVGRTARKLLPVAERYEAEYQAAMDASGIEPAVRAVQHLEDEVTRLLREIGCTPAVTLAGVRIKARVMVRFAATRRSGGLIAGTFGGHHLAEAVLAILGGDAHV